MIQFRLDPEDLAHVRFAFSPLWELVRVETGRIAASYGKPVAVLDRFARETGAALELLVCRGRARVLRELAAPATTGEVARRLSYTTSAASQHLTALARAGVVDRTRVGRRVYYALSARGRSVLEPLDGAPAVD